MSDAISAVIAMPPQDLLAPASARQTRTASAITEPRWVQVLLILAALGFLLGFLLAAYLNVPVLGIALLGVIIVALMLVNDQNKPNNTAVVDGGADDDF